MAKAHVKEGGENPQLMGENGGQMENKPGETRKRKTAGKKLLKEEILKQMKQEDWEEIIDGLIERAKENGRDFGIWRDSIGEKPVDKQELNIKEIPKIIIRRKDDGQGN